MTTLSKKMKTLLLTIVMTTVMFICQGCNKEESSTDDVSNSNNQTATFQLNNNILITAAHLGDIDGYKLMYQDDTRDVAYYIANNIQLSTIDNQSVSIEGLEGCEVVKAEPGIFYVKTSTPDQIVNGMSGTRVYNDSGTPIGFVDALVQGQMLKCITIE